MTFKLGAIIFPNVDQLDFTGPYDVLSRMPDTEILVVSETKDPVKSDYGLRIIPDTTFSSCPTLDGILVPGGSGVNEVIKNETALDFVSAQGEQAKYVLSVCTGAIIIGVAGLLRSYRATTHWLYMDLLPLFGSYPVHERVVEDRNRITCAGVTSGIDLALTTVNRLHGQDAAQKIQLMIEYDPKPPFDSGSPERASSKTVLEIKEERKESQIERRRLIEEALATRKMAHSVS